MCRQRTCVFVHDMSGMRWIRGTSPAIEIPEMSAAKPVCDAQGAQELLTDLAEVRGELREHNATFSRAEEWIRLLSRKVRVIPSADVIALENGIQIIWRNGDRHVWVMFAFSGASEDSIYKATTANRRIHSSNLIKPIQADSLVEVVEWLHAPVVA